MKIPGVRPPTTYAEQTYKNPFFVVRFAHQERYRRAIEVVQACRPRTLLDYGAGDGHVLRSIIANGGHRPERCIAYEPIKEMAASIGIREEQSGRKVALEVMTERNQLDAETFDLILCLGVLEHMPLNQRHSFYRLCQEQLSPEGCCLIDVPVEIGPSLLIKHLGRVLLKGRKSEYPTGTLLSAIVGRTVFDPRRFDPSIRSGWIGEHKGFDYRLFRQELEYHLKIVETFSTPFSWLPPSLGNQEVYFVAKPEVGES